MLPAMSQYVLNGQSFEEFPGRKNENRLAHQNKTLGLCIMTRTDLVEIARSITDNRVYQNLSKVLPLRYYSDPIRGVRAPP